MLNVENKNFKKISSINGDEIDMLIKVYKNPQSRSNLSEEFNRILNPEKDKFLEDVIIQLICGKTIKLKKISLIDSDELEKLENVLDRNNISICVSDDDFDEYIENMKSNLPEYEDLFELFVNCKEIHQFFLLAKLLGDNKYLSDAMVETYEKHKKELKELKEYIKTNAPEKYDRLFRKPKLEEINYSKYIGSYITKGERERFSHGKRPEFYKFLKKIFEEIENSNKPEFEGEENENKLENNENEYLKKVYNEISNDSYLLLVNSTSNGVFPYQLNKLEMEEIIKRQAKYYPFFNEVDEDGYVIKDKILSLLTFKIPYYVGPLAKPSDSNHSWIIRKEEGKILPWNFEEKVDKENTAKAFIQKMLSKCTYLHECNCLPANSIIFSYYNVLSFLNKIHINGSPIDYETKIDLLKDTFLVKRKVSLTDIKNHFLMKDSHVIISTSNGKSISNITCNMASYVDFTNIFSKEYVKDNILQIEEVINDITVFEDKKILEKRLKLEYNFSDDIIKKIKGLNYKNYGKLSKEFLMDLISFDENGESQGCILSIMQNGNQNLMEIINDEKYNFQKLIDSYNQERNKSLTPLEYINDLYVSPGMKRALIQAYKIIEEIEQILKRPIDEFYVECSRTNKAKKVQSKSRYEKLKELYENAKDVLKEDITYKKMYQKLLDEKDSNIFQSDKYYLYFTQMGKCMYTGEPIDFESLSDPKLYDIDHIFPRSMIKDDSLTNRVLVNYDKNRGKSDTYPIPQSILWNGNYEKAYEFYKRLKDAKLITEEKYNRLTKRELLESELDAFVNRQLVYTNQAVKGLIEVIKQFKSNGNNKPKIVYSKSEIVSDFRNNFDLPKSRSANNYHHAHDAYLNIVVGRVVDQHFSSFKNDHTSLIDMHKQGKTTNPVHIFENDKCEKITTHRIYWDKKQYLKLINHYLYETFDVLTTTRAFFGNKLFETTIFPAGEGDIPIKSKGKIGDTQKYGGLKKYKYSSYVLIKCKNNFIIESIPTIYRLNLKEWLDKKYNNYELIISNLKINTVCISENRKYCITGNSDDRFHIRNLWERNFNKYEMRVIHLIDKVVSKLKGVSVKGDESSEDIKKLGLLYSDKKLIISPARNKETKELSLTNEEILKFYDRYILMLKKKIYSYTTSKNIAKKLEESRDTFINLSVIGQIKLLSNLLNYLKCNESKSIDLSLIGLKKNAGKILVSKKLSKCKIITESITGFYTKVLKEI